MEFLTKVIFAFLVTFQVTLAQQQTIEIDTWDDLLSQPGWQLQCSQGYQENLADFHCNLLDVTIPAEELNGEVGFWTGCTANCVLTYRLNPSDVGFGFRAYLKDMQMVIKKNDLVHEYVTGDKWVEAYIDLSFTTSISLILTHRTRTEFIMLDKVFVVRETPTTTTPEPPTTTTTVPTTTTTVPTTTTTVPTTTTTVPTTTTTVPTTTTTVPTTTTPPSTTTPTTPIICSKTTCLPTTTTPPPTPPSLTTTPTTPIICTKSTCLTPTTTLPSTTTS